MENSAYPQTTVIHVIGYKPATPFQSSNGQRYPKLRDSIDVMKARSATKSPEFRTSPLTPGLTEIGRSLAFKVVAAFKGNLWRAFWKSRKVTTAVQRYKGTVICISPRSVRWRRSVMSSRLYSRVPVCCRRCH